MDKTWMMLLGAVVFASMFGCTPRTVSTEEAARAMGANDLHSIRYAGSGIQGGLLEGPAHARGAPEPGGSWPRHSLETYEILIDYQTMGNGVQGVARFASGRPD